MSYQAQRWQLLVLGWRILLGIVGENGGSVKRAVVLGEIEPALGPVGALTPDS